MTRKSSVLLVFFLGTVRGPVHTCLVLVMFPLQRCFGKGTDCPMLCIQLPAHLAALDICHLRQRYFKALCATYTTVFFHSSHCLHQAGIYLLSQMILLGFGPIPFSLNFPKLQGIRITQQLQPTCVLRNTGSVAAQQVLEEQKVPPKSQLL